MNVDIKIILTREAFEHAVNESRFFPAELNFDKTLSPSGREEYANGHIESNWQGFNIAISLIEDASASSASAQAVDAMDLVNATLPECKHECTSSCTEISDTVLIMGGCEDGSQGVGLGHYQDDGKWIHYGGDYDFMTVVKVIAWKPIPSQQAISRALQSQQSPVQASDSERRYEIVRKLTVPQFAELYRRNIAGEGNFDDLVDQLASDAGQG